LSDLVTEGNYVWVDNTPFKYTKWSSGQPGQKWYEDCVFVQADGTWTATYFNFKRSYACEMELGGGYHNAFSNLL
jgi:hypothetical protein